MKLLPVYATLPVLPVDPDCERVDRKCGGGVCVCVCVCVCVECVCGG